MYKYPHGCCSEASIVFASVINSIFTDKYAITLCLPYDENKFHCWNLIKYGLPIGFNPDKIDFAVDGEVAPNVLVADLTYLQFVKKNNGTRYRYVFEPLDEPFWDIADELDFDISLNGTTKMNLSKDDKSYPFIEALTDYVKRKIYTFPNK